MKHRSSQRCDGRFFPRGRVGQSREVINGFAGMKTRVLVEVFVGTNRAWKQFQHWQDRHEGLSFHLAQKLGDIMFVEVVGQPDEIMSFVDIGEKRGIIRGQVTMCINSHVPRGQSSRPWASGSGAKKKFGKTVH